MAIARHDRGVWMDLQAVLSQVHPVTMSVWLGPKRARTLAVYLLLAGLGVG